MKSNKSRLIKFDWEQLKYLPVANILKILNALVYKENMKSYPKYILEPISKFRHSTSFLSNPDGLLLNRRKFTNDDIYVYLSLASQRSYHQYKQTGSLTLPTYYVPEEYLNKLKMNPLMGVTDDKIIFRYEEN